MFGFSANRPAAGAVFTCRAVSFGIGTQSADMTIDDAAWDRCTACPEYRECYDLSLGKLVLSQALSARA
jgi:hypothetical protein